MAVVHIGEATLSRRVSEFASTPSAQLSSTDFEERGRQVGSFGCDSLRCGRYFFDRKLCFHTCRGRVAGSG